MNSLATATLADLLAHDRGESAARAELRRLLRLSLLPLALIAAALAAWFAIAPLAGAVMAPATVKVELNRKTVQHQEGGLVREIRVREGDRVRAGDVLLVIGDLKSDAELNVQQDLLRAALARQASAAAEAAFAPRVNFAAADATMAEHVARENALFAARRRNLDEQIAALQLQIRQAQAQGDALRARIDATRTSAQLADEELQLNESLVEQGFVSRPRLLGLQRASADYRARVAEFTSEMAEVAQRIGELQARSAQLRNSYQAQAEDELKEATARVRELEQRLRPSQDQVERQLVRAPVDGQVMALRVAAIGEAVAPRQPLVDVVPSREKLVVEARIRTEDIEHVQAGAAAEVRLSGVDAAVIRPLPGTVTFVSPDRVSDPNTRDAWFVATVEVEAAALADRRDVRLQPGMPSEVFVTTRERSVLAYLAKPFAAFTARALREP